MSSRTDRFLVGASAPGSAMWLVVLIILVGTAWSALTDGRMVVEGLLSAVTVVGVISILNRTLGWPFWPRGKP